MSGIPLVLIIWWALAFVGWCASMGAFLPAAIRASRRRYSHAERIEALGSAWRFFWLVIAFTLGTFVLDRLMRLL